MPVPTLPPLSPRVVVAPEHATSQVRRLQMLNLSPRVAASGGKIGLFNYNSHPHASVKSPRAMPHARTHTFTRSLMRHAESEEPEDSARTLARIEARRADLETMKARHAQQKRDQAEFEARKRHARRERQRRRNAAARHIQSHARGSMRRRQLRSFLSQLQAERELTQQTRCALSLQALTRGRNGRHTAQHAHAEVRRLIECDAARTIQRRWRRVHAERAALIAMLRANEAYFAEMRAVLVDDAARRLQRAWRQRTGHHAPRLYNTVREALDHAALVIQRARRQRKTQTDTLSPPRPVKRTPTATNLRDPRAGVGEARLARRGNIKRRNSVQAHRVGGGFGHAKEHARTLDAHTRRTSASDCYHGGLAGSGCLVRD